MSRPDPIQYAERLYAAIRAADFSALSFLAFGNAVKDGVDLRRMPRIAAEPFMRVVGEMLDLEEASGDDAIVDAAMIERASEGTTPRTEGPLTPGVQPVERAQARPAVDSSDPSDADSTDLPG